MPINNMLASQKSIASREDHGGSSGFGVGFVEPGSVSVLGMASEGDGSSCGLLTRAV
jgi:hypothetical protein